VRGSALPATTPVQRVPTSDGDADAAALGSDGRDGSAPSRGATAQALSPSAQAHIKALR
jgi:hypothetical protein